MDLKKTAALFSLHMCGKFGARVINKETSVEMRGVAMGMDIGKFFGADGLASGHDFMEHFTTTLGTNIYMPAAHRADPVVFMEILTHELQHVIQFGESRIAFAWLYLKEPEARVKYEVDAYAAGLAVAQWLTGELPADSAESIAARLTAGYALRPEDAALAVSMLKSHMASLKSGVVMAASAREAIKYLEATEPALHLNGRG
jgi:AcrR family transcriptional regulator